jgi:hypothetical protein
MTQEPTVAFTQHEFAADVSRRTHARRVLSKTETRVANGVYVETEPWRNLAQRDRYLLMIRAIAQTRRKDMVLSHWSAAALHGLPIVGPWPSQVHVSIGRVSGGRSRRGVAKHALVVSDNEVVEIDGMLVTSIPRTLIDLSIYGAPSTAIVALDRALLVDRQGRTPALVQPGELWDSYIARGTFRGAARARRMLEFGTEHSESPLESVSRLNMKIIRCPLPELQVAFHDHAGLIGYTDFYWRNSRLVGEADGDVKYLNESLRGGRTADEVVLDEKRREDRIRALHEGVTRWPWAIGINPQALRAHLRRAGLPIP